MRHTSYVTRSAYCVLLPSPLAGLVMAGPGVRGTVDASRMTNDAHSPASIVHSPLTGHWSVPARFRYRRGGSDAPAGSRVEHDPVGRVRSRPPDPGDRVREER